MILIRFGGMRSPSAVLWRNRNSWAERKLHGITTRWTVMAAIVRRLVAANDDEYLAAVSEYTIDVETTRTEMCCWVPEWATHSWVMDELKEANPHWPYKSRRAKLDNILRGDKVIAISDGALRERWPVYYRQVRMKTIRNGPHVYKGPCLRCRAPCIFEMSGIFKPHVDGIASLHMRFHCIYGHEEQHIVQDGTKACGYMMALGIRFEN